MKSVTSLSAIVLLALTLVMAGCATVGTLVINIFVPGRSMCPVWAWQCFPGLTTVTRTVGRVTVRTEPYGAARELEQPELDPS